MKYGYINDIRAEDTKKIMMENELGIDEENIFIENNRINKISLKNLLELVNEKDTLTIIDIAEVAGTIKQVCSFIDECSERKIILVLNEFKLDFSKIDLKTSGMIEMVKILLSCERKIIDNRIKRGVNEAKGNGKRLGRPRKQIEELPDIFKNLYPLYEGGVIGATELAKRCQMSRPRIINYIKRMEEIKMEENNEKEGY